MALPGVRTILHDRFYALSRSNAPEGVRVAAIARRSTTAGDIVEETGQPTPQDYDPYTATNEKSVMRAFGEGSELHRAYVELVAGGAARIILIPIPADQTDSDLEDTDTGNPLEKAFEAVEAAQADIVVPWGRGSHPTEWQNPATPDDDPSEFGFHADNSASATTSFAKRVADYCAEISGRSNPCIAILGVKPYIGTSESITPANLTTHLDVANLVDKESEPMGTNGHLLNVVATELRPTGYPQEWGYSNGAAVYAGYVSSLRSELATTGRKLFNVDSLRYVPTRPQQEALINKGIVPVALDFSRAATIIDGLTFAKEGSDYSRLTTLRIVYDAVQLIRQTCQSYIGLPATLEYRASMETAITNRLRQMTLAGVLLDSDFLVTYDASNNKAIIELVLRPAFEIRNIEVSVAVQL